jgi:L-asparaginase
MKKILLVATGGTIASTVSTEGLAPTFDAEQLLAYMPEIKDLCRVEGLSVMNVDSTNMTPTLMAEIAAAIYGHYHDYDGFVVTHGTDTLGYTAAALTYMLQNIKKPVVVTGSQVAIEALYTDAKKNISDAIRFALEDNAGIFVAFDGHIINGTRANKMKTQSTDAFSSINFPRIADIKLGKITYNNALNYGEHAKILDADPRTPFVLRDKLCEEVFLLKITPGIKAEIFDYLKVNYKGVVIESFGIGGIPNQQPDIVAKLEELIQAGVAVVITTQCLEEGIDLGIYAVGRNLAKHAVISGGDMNSEAIVSKLMWALGNFASIADVKYFMETPVFGDRSN